MDDQKWLDEKGTYPHRYVQLYLFKAVNRIFGREPFYHYYSSIFFHSLTSLLLFWFIYLLTENRLAALVVSLIFCVDYVNGHAVSFLAVVGDILATAFALLTLILLYVDSKRGSVFFYIASIITFNLALFSKESSSILPLLIIILLLIYHPKKLVYFLKLTPYLISLFLFVFLNLYDVKRLSVLSAIPDIAEKWIVFIINCILNNLALFFPSKFNFYFKQDFLVILLRRIILLLSVIFLPIFIFEINYFRKFLENSLIKLSIFAFFWLIITPIPNTILPQVDFQPECYWRFYSPSISFAILLGISPFIFLEMKNFKKFISIFFVLFIIFYFFRNWKIRFSPPGQEDPVLYCFRDISAIIAKILFGPPAIKSTTSGIISNEKEEIWTYHLAYEYPSLFFSNKKLKSIFRGIKSSQIDPRLISLFKPGFSKGQVLALLGPPDKIEFFKPSLEDSSLFMEKWSYYLFWQAFYLIWKDHKLAHFYQFKDRIKPVFDKRILQAIPAGTTEEEVDFLLGKPDEILLGDKLENSDQVFYLWVYRKTEETLAILFKSHLVVKSDIVVEVGTSTNLFHFLLKESFNESYKIAGIQSEILNPNNCQPLIASENSSDFQYQRDKIPFDRVPITRKAFSQELLNHIFTLEETSQLIPLIDYPDEIRRLNCEDENISLPAEIWDYPREPIHLRILIYGQMISALIFKNKEDKFFRLVKISEGISICQLETLLEGKLMTIESKDNEKQIAARRKTLFYPPNIYFNFNNERLEDIHW